MVYIISVVLCALCGNFIVKNGAAAQTLFMQNEPNLYISLTIISLFIAYAYKNYTSQMLRKS